VPDDLGSPLANPLCLDSRLGRVHTYLTRDVPAWISAHLQVDTTPGSWAVGGSSAGGTCTVGETAADYLNVSLNLGLTGTSVATGVLLAGSAPAAP